MKKYLFIAAWLFAAVSLPIAFTGCQSSTLESGGVYSDPILASADQAILSADQSLTGFTDWVAANSAFLAQFPELEKLADNIKSQKNGWLKDAYAARDDYAAAMVVYKQAVASGSSTAIAPTTAKIDAAISLLTSVVQQITAARAAHPNV